MGVIRVLLVEDDQLARQFLCARLALEPDLAVVDSTPDGDAALEVLRREGVDVVVLDYQLVGGTSMRLLRSILRGSDPTSDARRIPYVLYCTGWASPELEHEVRAAGGSGVVSKTEAGQDLPSAIRAVAAGGKWFPGAADSSGSALVPGRWRILVADHDRATRALLQEALEQLGCSITFAWDGRGTMERLEAEPFDLCFLSHRLPGPPRATDVLHEVESRFPALRVLLVETRPSSCGDVPQSYNVRGLVESPSDPSVIYEQALRVLKS